LDLLNVEISIDHSLAVLFGIMEENNLNTLKINTDKYKYQYSDLDYIEEKLS